MSGFILNRTAQRIEIVADGGVYDRNGAMLRVIEKVHLAPALPLAVMLRGEDDGFCQEVADAILQIAGGAGTVDKTLAGTSQLFTSLSASGYLAKSPSAEITAAAFSETGGSVAVMINTRPWTVDGHDVPIGTWQDLAPVFVAGLAPVLGSELVAAGLTLPPETAPPEMLEQHGIAAMELLRCKPMSADDWQRHDGLRRATYAIGGHVQYVSITPAGATSRIVKVWPDEIGRPIAPAGCDAQSLVSDQPGRVE